jgi:Domain of unknown function (DUF6881)
MKVKLKRGWSKTYATLTVGNVYRVLGIEAGDLRIIDDTGEPCLFSPTAFEFVDAAQPSNWVSERGEGGELYSYPPELNDPRCFFEKFHDHDVQVRRKFSAYMVNLCHSERAADPDPPNSYIRVEWKHEHPDEPILLYSELDEERWEVRKVEVFRGGGATYAWAKGSTGTTWLGERPVPTLAEIAADAVFVVREISRVDFEAVWDQALEAEVS